MSNLKKSIDKYIKTHCANRNNHYANDYEALGMLITQTANAILESKVTAEYFKEFRKAVVTDADKQVKDFAINDMRRHAWLCACEMIELAIACDTYKKGTEK